MRVLNFVRAREIYKFCCGFVLYEMERGCGVGMGDSMIDCALYYFFLYSLLLRIIIKSLSTLPPQPARVHHLP